MLKVLTKELGRSIDQEEIGLLCVAKFMVKLVRATCILEDCPSARRILLHQAHLLELLELLLCKFSVAAHILVVSVRDIELHQGVFVQEFLPLIGRPLGDCLFWELEKLTELKEGNVFINVEVKELECFRRLTRLNPEREEGFLILLNCEVVDIGSWLILELISKVFRHLIFHIIDLVLLSLHLLIVVL